MKTIFQRIILLTLLLTTAGLNRGAPIAARAGLTTGPSTAVPAAPGAPAPAAPAAAAWTQITTSVTPTAGGPFAMVYDSHRQRSVLYTGGTTWEYDGANWTQMSPAASPPGRMYFAMVYDSARQRVVLFGGKFSSAFNDTWEYDGVTWRQAQPSASPPARYSHAMAYDSERQRVVLFGGYNGSDSLLADTWEYNGATWTKFYETSDGPYYRAGHRMAYDAARKRTVLFGGAGGLYAFGDTWEFDGAAWYRIHPAHNPGTLSWSGMAYDSARQRIVLFGGDHPFGGNVYNRTWEYDGVDWKDVSPAASPGARTGVSMAYDIERGVVVLYGGCNAVGCSGLNVGRFSDTWEYIPGGGGAKSWTILFYAAGDNDLAGLLAEFLGQRWFRQQYDHLAYAAGNPNVNLIGFYDSKDADDSKYTVFTAEGVQNWPMGEVNTGDPDTLVDFLDWARTNYPAPHYALVVASHGHGISGVGIDESSDNDRLRPHELKAALSDPRSPHLDILMMNACLQGTLEMGYQVRSYVDYYVASEAVMMGEIGANSFINGTGSIPPITGSTTPAALAEAMARSYVGTFSLAHKSGKPGAISVADLDQTATLHARASALAGVLRQTPGAMQSLVEINQTVQHYEENGDGKITSQDRIIDLYHFASLVKERFGEAAVRNAADALMAAVDDYILYEAHWSGEDKGAFWLHNNSHGVSTFFAPEKKECYYTDGLLDYASGTTWTCSTGSSWRDAGVNAPQTPLASEWGQMLVDYLAANQPEAVENPDPPELVEIAAPGSNSFLTTFLSVAVQSQSSGPPPAPTLTPTRTRIPTATPIPTLNPAPWRQASPWTAPTHRLEAGMAYDASRGYAVLFGGDDTGAARLDDTWIYDHGEWTQLYPATIPPFRTNIRNGMAYDAARRRIVLFGGLGNGYLNDTWEFDGSDWSRVDTAVSPPGRDCHNLVYDSRRGVMVLFGGWTSAGPVDDTWEYDGSTWTQVNTTAAPPAMRVGAMAYDARRGVAVLFGGWNSGVHYGETWEYDGQDWAQKSFTTWPAARGGAAMWYDSFRHRVVLFGGGNGYTSLNDTWEYDGAAWTQVSSSGAIPTVRYEGSFTYDSGRHVGIVFGGAEYWISLLSDTWEYDR